MDGRQTIVEVQWPGNRRFFSDMRQAYEFVGRQAVNLGVGTHEFVYIEHRLDPDA